MPTTTMPAVMVVVVVVMEALPILAGTIAEILTLSLTVIGPVPVAQSRLQFVTAFGNIRTTIADL